MRLLNFFLIEILLILLLNNITFSQPPTNWEPVEMLSLEISDSSNCYDIYSVSNSGGLSGFFAASSVPNVFKEVSFGGWCSSFQIPGITDVKDQSSSPWSNIIFAGSSSNIIYPISTSDPQTLNPFIYLQDTNIVASAICYDALRNAFWVCDLASDIYLINMDGETIQVIPNPGLNSKTGLAFFNELGPSGNSYPLLIFDQSGGGATIYELNVDAGTLTGNSINVNEDFNISGGLSGGLCNYIFNGEFEFITISCVVKTENTDYICTYNRQISWQYWDPTFILFTPENQSYNLSTNPTFDWNDQDDNNYYSIQISSDPNFSNIIINENYIPVSEYNLPEGFNFDFNTTYYWRVYGINNNYVDYWSSTWSFTTEPENPIAIEIPLSLGWNIISSNIVPTEPAMESVFEGMNNIVLVKNGVGQIYSPAFGINQIGDWNVEAGYYVYTNAGSLLNISGNEVNPVLQGIELNAGWNLVSYLRNNPMNVQQALASISSNLIMAKNNSGGFYHPGFGINTLGDMQPGQGYWLYITAPTILNYPGN
ncbi:MAG TPA: fibronectin type III domain-containing protein, partial [Candidatus Kapabacteria bacterium]|nr:fibronectin type III domain-containing protein [Candidatus Kapabacteria bacterium]